MPVGDDGEFFVYTDWAYRSEVDFFLYESTEFRGKASLEGGLRIGYNWGYGDYEVALFGRNITDTTRIVGGIDFNNLTGFRSEEHTSELQSLMRISYAVFCLKKKQKYNTTNKDKQTRE